jgi:hypothetical protein
MRVCCNWDTNIEVKWEVQFVWEVLWFDFQRDPILQVVSKRRLLLLWKELKWLNFVKIQMNKIWRKLWWKLFQFVIVNSTHSNEEMMRYHQKIMSIDCMINWEIDVELVCWFDLRCVWFDLNWDPDVCEVYETLQFWWSIG